MEDAVVAAELERVLGQVESLQLDPSLSAGS
jgi:hypothetical protein